MVEQTFSINNAWRIDPPCYVRKVDRAGHWADAATIQDKVLCSEPDDDGISVYLVSSPSDLARVAIALNANRSSLTEDLILVAIATGELAAIDASRTNGETLCKWANHLHHDLVFADAAAVSRLATTLLGAGRRPHRFKKKAMQEALDYTSNDHCYAAEPNSVHCVCEDDLPAPQTAAWLTWLRRVVARSLAGLFGKTASEK